MIPSKSDPIPTLVRKIHDAGVSMALVATGGGSRAISELLEVPGASRSVLEAAVPYAAPALVRYLGFTPTQFCSAATARAMAMAAFQRARSFTASDPLRLAGVSCTASLASDRPKRGPHRIYVATQTARLTEVWTLELMKGARSRAEEEYVTSQLVLNAVATAASIGEQLSISIVEGEAIVFERSVALPEWTDLLLGKCDVVLAHEPDTRKAIFPGAFNPPHVGHFRMAEIAADQLGVPVTFEISIENVDKPPLDFYDIENRLAQLADRPVWLTRAPTFVTKAQLFPGATFVVGADTLERIGDPKYYGDDTTKMLAAIDSIADSGCRFLTFGRNVGNRFQSLAELDIPPTLRAISHEVPADIFRLDISSTELRKLGGDEFVIEETSWEDLKWKLPIGAVVSCTVTKHAPFGVFTAIPGISFKGLVQITDFKDEGLMTTEEYPKIGAKQEAVVLGYKETGHQIWLGVRPSQLARGKRDSTPAS